MSPEDFSRFFLNLGFSKELVVLVISALPVVELRLAIPLAINVYGLPWYYALSLALIGNMLPVPFLLLFIENITRWLSKKDFFKKAFNRFVTDTKRRGEIIERYKLIGLMLFVAIPLPATGAWTGSLAAVLFGLKFWHAFLSIGAGVFIAGVIVTCLSLLGWIGAIIAGIGLIGLAAFSLWKT